MAKSDGGRYPMAMVAYDKNNIRVTVKRLDDVIRIRIDDIVNISRWEELSIPVVELMDIIDAKAS